ncbi:MAG TPA: type II CAAX endopeptidase family protein [Verrucomicrobiae bacterium]|nr:type II CAAX endopeptidase family protein [Verrucomicrobiae bacterium]
MLSEKPWNWDRVVRVFIAVLFFVSVFFLVMAATQHYAGKTKLVEGSLAYVVLGSLGFHGSILFGTAIILASDHLNWGKAFGFSSRPLTRAMLLGFAAALVFLPVGMVLQDVSLRALDWFHVPTPPQPAVEQFDKATSVATRVYLAFFAVVLAPVAEEIFFRGILYAAIKQFGFPRLALWGSALIFATIHLTPAIFVPLLLLSLILVWLYEKTDNLLAPITAHAVFNGINLLLMYYSDDLAHSIQRFFPHFK